MKCIEDEIPFEVPEGWEWERLNNIASFSGGKTPSTSHSEYWGDDVLWITSKDMKYKYITDSLIKLSNKGASLLQIYPQNSLLMVTRSGILRHTLPVAILKKEATINQDLKAISLYYSFLTEYIYLCIKGMETYILLHYSKSGTTVENINFDEFQRILLPIPPQSEIKRIISVFDDASELIEQIVQGKDGILNTIPMIKSKILDLAIRGKLVPQNPDDEPASVLLERIRSEKEALIKQGKIKRDKNESVIFRGDDNCYYLTGNSSPLEMPFDIPDTWAWSTLYETCNYGETGSVDPSEISGDAWILDLEDIEKDSGIVFQKVLNKVRKTNSTKHRFQHGMVLYSKLRPYLNKVVIADEDGYCTSEILPLKFIPDVQPEYAQIFLMSPYFVNYANACSYGMKMPRLGTKDGQKSLIPIPPYNEQVRISNTVKKINCFLNFISESL